MLQEQELRRNKLEEIKRVQMSKRANHYIRELERHNFMSDGYRMQEMKTKKRGEVDTRQTELGGYNYIKQDFNNSPKGQQLKRKSVKKEYDFVQRGNKLDSL